MSDEYEQLPEETKEFIRNLREDDIEDLREGLRRLRELKTIGAFSKWVIITTLGVFLGVVGLWENLLKVFSWLKGTP